MCDAFLFFFFSLSDTKTHWYEVKNGIPSWFIQNSQTVHNLAQAPQRHPKQNPKITPLIQIDLGSTPSSFQLTELLALCLNVRRETDYMSWHLKDERKWRVFEKRKYFLSGHRTKLEGLGLLDSQHQTTQTTFTMLITETFPYVAPCDCECVQLLDKCWISLYADPHRKRLISAMVCIQGKENHYFYTLNSSIYTL